MDTARHTHDSGGAVSSALFSCGFVLRGIPGFPNLSGCRIQRYARKIAFDRSHHAPAPVFCHYRDPVAGEIDRRRLFGCLRRTPAPAAATWGTLGTEAYGNKN